MGISKNPPPVASTSGLSSGSPKTQSQSSKKTAEKKVQGKVVSTTKDSSVKSVPVSPENKANTKPLSLRKAEAVSADSKITQENQADELKSSKINTITSIAEDSDAGLDQQIKMTRAHKLLLAAKLDNSEVKEAIVALMKARLVEKGSSPTGLSPEQFRQELTDTMIELDDRGISLGRSTLTDVDLEENLSDAKLLVNDYKKYKEIDNKLTSFLESDQCEKWDSEEPFFRGGKYYFESKLVRNIEKDKKAFKPGSINVKGRVYGKGLYVADQISVTTEYAPRQHKGIIAIYLKPETPCIDIRNREVKKELSELLGVDESVMLNYFENMCPHDLVLKHDRGEISDTYFTIKSPDIIDKVAVVEDINPSYFPSTSRLDESGDLIKGHPTQFKEVLVPEDANLIQLEDSLVKGDAEKRAYPVFTYTNQYGISEYVIKSPVDESIYWSVKPAPHEGTKTFIVEPCPSFLKARRLDKIKALAITDWSESKPAIKLLQDAFNTDNT